MSLHRPAARWRPDPENVDRRSRTLSQPPAAARSGEPRAAVSAAAFPTPISAITSPPRCGSIRSCTAFSWTGRCAARPNCARSADACPSRPRPPSAWKKDWQSHGVGSALLERTLLTARNRGDRASAHGLPLRQPPDAAARPQVRRRTELRFRRGGRRGRGPAPDAAVDGPRDGVGRTWFRNRYPGCAIPAAAGNLTLTSRYRFGASLARSYRIGRRTWSREGFDIRVLATAASRITTPICCGSIISTAACSSRSATTIARSTRIACG